jgi:hypothetical protein
MFQNLYDQTLFYTHRLACDDLLYIMYDTNDDFLSRRIERFIKSFISEKDLTIVETFRQDLISYLEHAVNVTEPEMEWKIF